MNLPDLRKRLGAIRDRVGAIHLERTRAEVALSELTIEMHGLGAEQDRLRAELVRCVWDAVDVAGGSTFADLGAVMDKLEAQRGAAEATAAAEAAAVPETVETPTAVIE